ncbi:MAG TPA: zinc ABC transporter substrate-binding protein, partial [Alphaproteobacteria bacterium]|nr:zinc ABC transporter substrate-binding protein [Alphaproteobacteria bacterium]
MRFVYLTFFLLLFSMPVRAATDAAEGEILVTIKPLHSLVSAVAGPEQNVALLLTGNYSPHDFALRPSQMRQLQSAKVFFYVGEGLESFLLQVLPSLPNDQLRVAVSHSPS